MKEPEEILKSWGIEVTPRLVEAVAEAQRGAWNEALDVAAKNADTKDFFDKYGEWVLTDVDEQSILKLKK